MSIIGRTPAFATALTSAEPESAAFECYCGIDAACPVFRLMTPQQRVNCSRDKRQTAQAYYRDGVRW
jgi:uncharacterized protein with FMN-binding domain